MILTKNLLLTKAVTKSAWPKNFLAAPKMVFFFGAARNMFGPSYFVTTSEFRYEF